MSIDNTITRAGRDVEVEADQAEQPRFQIPSELRKRYDVRIVPGQDDADRRIGLFLSGDRKKPAIEISGNGDRIVAHREDPETVAALVTIAKHNGWEGIEVDGSPAFRKAVWAAGTREGLVVRGYEPEFAELAQMDKLRREDAERHERKAAAKAPVAEHAPARSEPNGAGRALNAERSGEAGTGLKMGGELSPGDQKLLLTLSAYTQDRKGLEESVRGDMSPMEREFHSERLGANRAALDGAVDRVLESQTLVSAFSKAGYEPDDLRRMARADQWDGEVAEAIQLVRSGLGRETPRAIAPAETAEHARYRVDQWKIPGRYWTTIGETNSAVEAVGLFKGAVDTRVVDTRDERTLSQADWGGDGGYPIWEVSPELKRLVSLEVEGRGDPASEQRHPGISTPGTRSPSNDPASAYRSESDELAELFLNGPPERLAAEPRLANAVEAQAAMERHLVEVFDGDRSQTSAAALESRQMISDVLRRGLDVSVREPTPVRQIESPHIAPDLER